MATQQGFHNSLALGCPDGGMEFDKKERGRNFEKIVYVFAINIDPSPLQ